MTSPCGSRSGPIAQFEDDYETELIDLVNRKRAGKPITAKGPRAATWST
ncbi:non-homologous end joining protein Ku [Bradyrhizobium elkanii]|nr:hypothetical protein [Bradyrhizobium elkanii]MCS3479301.1 non-homologous end joining protein Ku [Bradyrhizobium elkanii]